MSQGPPAIGSWRGGPAALDAGEIAAAIGRFREPTHVVREPRSGRIGVVQGGEAAPGAAEPGALELLASLPPLYPEWLGDRSFGEAHGARFPYVTGAMANGIATARLVIEVGRAGMLGFFGAAGLAPEPIEKALAEIESALPPGGEATWGSNLIHSPAEPELEEAVADLYLRRGVPRICASAYMNLTPAVVRFAASGLTTDASGEVVRSRQVLAKVSRPEVARRFLSPAPMDVLEARPSSSSARTS
jgi:hypothetical protein